MTKRTDIHTPTNIVPRDYSHVLHYSLSSSEDGVRIPSIGVNCECGFSWVGDKPIQRSHDTSGRCCVVALRASGVLFAETGNIGKCSVCGARYVHGEIWKHESSGEHIHIGHICGEKYELLVDYSAHEMKLDHARRMTARVIEAEKNTAKRSAMLASNPGLETALLADHYIIRDIAQRFASYHSISDKQIALVMKIARELSEPKATEAHVAAPIGRVTFQGQVVSVKAHESMYGVTNKMTIKVTTPDGAWLAWMTVPSSISRLERGATVSVTATLSAGRDRHFAIGKRPTATIVEPSAA